MVADYNTFLGIKGTKEELRASLNVLKSFENKEYMIRLDSVKVGKMRKNGKTVKSSITYLERLTSYEEIDKFLDSIGDSMAVDALGPYGDYEWIGGVLLFESILDAAPSVSLTGSIDGFTNAGDDHMWCKTEDGKLHKYYQFESDDGDQYYDYVRKNLPYSEFEKIFKISDGYYEEYYKYMGQWFEHEARDIYGFSYAQFVDIFPTEITEDEFKKVKEHIRDLSIMTREEFENSEEYEPDRGRIPDKECIYDPVTKEYHSVK
jgi:hypothetical protein